MTTNKGDDLDRNFVQEFKERLATAFGSISISVFLCGRGLPAKRSRRDIRIYLRSMLEEEIETCRVKLGEHKRLIRTYKSVAGKTALNLADHEYALANKIDLVVIFPCSAGSLAELGMFCLEDDIARKMVIFLNPKYKGSRSYVVNGPVAAAKRRNSKVFYVNYSNKEKIWRHVRNLVLDIRANKGKNRLFKP